MARKAEIQYVDQFYLFGSEAPRQAPAPKRGKFKVPEHYWERFQKISVDPVALGGLIAAAVMLCLLTAGGLHLRDTRAEYDQVKAQLTQLKRENAQLSHTYHTRYDLADIQTQAEAQGMIPEEEADSFTVFFSIPEPPKEKTKWDDFKWFLSWLFSDSEDYVIATPPSGE